MTFLIKKLIHTTVTVTLAAVLAVGCMPAFAPAAFAQEPVQDYANQVDPPQTDGILVTLEGELSDQINTLSIDELRIDDNLGEMARGAGATDVARIADELEAQGMDITATFENVEGETMLAVNTTEGTNDIERAAQIEGMEGVAAAQPNYVYELVDTVEDIDTPSEGAVQAARDLEALAARAGEGMVALANYIPNDPYANVSNADAQNNQYWLYNANIPAAWSLMRTNNKVTIAILDSHIQTSQEDLKANILIQYGWDFTVNSGTGCAYSKSPNNPAGPSSTPGHGTHVAGIVAAAANNEKGVAGGSYNANILPITIMNDQGKSNTKILINALNYVVTMQKQHPELNIRVINMSVGSYNSVLDDKALKSAITTARNSYNIVSVCAGGNGNGSSAPRTDKLYPADFDDCVSVTSLNPHGGNTVYSDYNQYKDISAPGERIYSTVAPNINKTDPAFNSTYGTKSGTSMASPLVASVFALVFAAAPEATVDDAIKAVESTADPIDDPVNDRSTVSGTHGAINAAKAVEAIQEQYGHFPDVLPYHWYNNAAEFVYDWGIMTGNKTTLEFEPDYNLTREQAAQVLYNYYGRENVSPACNKVDVDQNAWYAMAVNWCVSTGIMGGYKDGTNRFGIGDSITREALCSTLARVSGAQVSSADPTKFNNLPDHATTHFYHKADVIWAVDAGIINGAIDPATGTSLLKPLDYVTRAQIATIFMNGINNRVL